MSLGKRDREKQEAIWIEAASLCEGWSFYIISSGGGPNQVRIVDLEVEGMERCRLLCDLLAE